MKSLLLALLFLFQPLSAQAYAADTAPTVQHVEEVELQQREAEENSGFGQTFTKMLFMLGLTLLIFVVGAYFAKNYLLTLGSGLRSTKPGVIQVIEKRALSQKSCIYLVDVEGERILIAEFPAGGQVIRHMRFDDKKV